MKQIDITSTSNPFWAKKLFEQAIIKLPDNQYLLSKGITLCLNCGFDENLVQYLNKHLEVFANDFSELRRVADISFNNRKYKLAAIYFEKCLKFDPQNVNIKSRLSLCYWEIGKTKESVSLVEELLKERPDSLRVLAFAASRFLMMKEKDKAIHIIQNMENLYKDNPVIFKLKALNAVIEGDDKVADEYYLKASKEMPQDREIIMYLGKRYADQKLWGKSIDHFKSALTFSPNEPFFLQELSDLYLHCPETKLRDLNQAEYYSERAFNSIKTPSLTRLTSGKNLAEIYAREKKWDKALTILNMAIYGAKVLNISNKDVQDMHKMQDIYSLMQQNLK